MPLSRARRHSRTRRSSGAMLGRNFQWNEPWRTGGQPWHCTRGISCKSWVMTKDRRKQTEDTDHTLVSISRVSDILRMDHHIRWTPFMEESLRILQQQPEWEGDLVLATQVRCALVTQQLTEIVVSISISGEKQIPLYLHKALLSQVYEIWRTLPASLSQNGTSGQ